jgi:dTDP-4-amino-4,6-dideoxygalactose transaminase
MVVNKKTIIFHEPYITGNEVKFIKDVIKKRELSQVGTYSKKCIELLYSRYGFKNTFLTTSCTDAMEAASLIFNIKFGDEVIVPSYTFVTTANAFALRGASLIFADSNDKTPNIDETKIESLITKNTKALAIVHYAGIACDMDRIKTIVNRHNLLLLEDCAQGLDAYYKEVPLGLFGDISAFSFHSSKNITCGEGGLLNIINPKLVNKSEKVVEKGTNRQAFIKGEVNKYTWVDLGSSFLNSELNLAFLYAQLCSIDFIQAKLEKLWNRYQKNLESINNEFIKTPVIPAYAKHNSHCFYIVCSNGKERDSLQLYLRKKNIQSVFHFISLHSSPYFRSRYKGRVLVNADMYTKCLLRLPLFTSMRLNEVDFICEKVIDFFK